MLHGQVRSTMIDCVFATRSTNDNGQKIGQVAILDLAAN